MKNNKRKPDGEKIFSIVASLAIAIALVAGIVSVIKTSTKDIKKKNYIDLNVAEIETETEKVTEKIIEKVTERVTEKPTEKSTEKENRETTAEFTSEEPTEETRAVATKVYNFTEESVLDWPVSGNVIIGYNMDKTVYFPTLDLYRCNPAVIVSAVAGEDVKASTDGVVNEIYFDGEAGNCVKLALGGGYEIIYGQLTDLAVGVGDEVAAGQVIGKIAEPTKYFTKEGYNLYMMLTKDGNPVDPLLYLNEE